MLQVLLKNLRSDSVGSQDYVLKFCFKFLDRLAEEPPWVLQRILEERLTASDSRFKEAWVVSRPDSWGSKQKWDERLQKALEGFQPSERVWDDDIPF